jgi:co-chaperonin GroES (HSP10)
MASVNSVFPDSKKIRRVNPVGMRVVVRLRKESNKSDAGLFLPEGAKEATLESLLAEVVEVASATDIETDEEANISGIPLGATVIIAKRSGITVPWDDELRIVDTKEVLAIVHEVEVS